MDQFALKCLEDELHKTYKVPQNKKILDFERKTKEDKAVQTGLSMEQLKAQHRNRWPPKSSSVTTKPSW